MLKPSSRSEIAARATVHLFQEITEIASATTSQAAPTHRDVTQSQLTAGESLDIEHPQGLDTITKTDRRADSSARAAKARAIDRVARSAAFRETAIAQV
jgi:hypothetical protein